jgi:predicted MFS family arabinose efflux permease
MGINSTSFAMASVLGVPFALYLTNIFDWHAGFRFLGVLSLFIFTVLFKVVPSQSQYVQKRHAGRDVLLPLKNVVKNSSQVWALCFAGSLVLGQFMIIPFLSPSLMANAGLTKEQLPLIYLVGGALTLVTGPIVGRLADRHGKQKIFLIGLLSAMVPILLITHLGRIPLWLILCIVGVFFICVNARWVPALAMISGSATPQNRGSFMSFVGCTQQLAAAAGAMVSGWIVVKDETTGQLLRYGWTGYIALGMSMVAILFSYRVRVVDVDPPVIPPPMPAEPQAPA